MATHLLADMRVIRGGRREIAAAMVASFEKTRRLLGWLPPISLDEGLRRAAGGLL